MKILQWEILFLLLLSSFLGNAQEYYFDNDNSLGLAFNRVWELEPAYRKGTFRITAYRPVYLMPFRITNNPVKQPISRNPFREQPTFTNYQVAETKFQISMKAKVVQDAIFGKGDIWVAFSEQAYWQVFNEELSRPFRELNYEPEIIFTYPLNFSAGHFKMRMLGVSVNHHSNGKGGGYSRSWNRLILLSAFEYKKINFTLRLWKRFKENNEQDDNPDIENYLGQGELMLGYVGKHLISTLLVQNNLKFGTNRTRLELNLIYPIVGNLKLLIQSSYGYGDNLIDYNYKQKHIGIGFIFFE